MDVELPDGTVIEGVPDGMSKADLVAKLKANGYDTSKLGAPEAAPAKLSPAESFKAGLSNFVGKDLLMGGLRGAAGIGATIMQPFQAALDPAGTNQAMRAGIDGRRSFLARIPDGQTRHRGGGHGWRRRGSRGPPARRCPPSC
jgi:hypothetical protein